ncbi:MAG: double zinc ribbon domain-containing protein, partial [Thiobacillus sp.]|nr:double zinc ribbon domain-containing protein [Thiobacillus sp.]
MPPACLLCGATSPAAACPGCRADLPWLKHPCCPVCATPTPGGATC